MSDRNRPSTPEDETVARVESDAVPMSLFREWLGFYSDIFGVGGGIGAVVFFFMWVLGWLPDFLALILVSVFLTLLFVSITAHAFMSSRYPIESIGTWLPDYQKVLKEKARGTPDQDSTLREADSPVDATPDKKQQQSVGGRQPEPVVLLSALAHNVVVWAREWLATSVAKIKQAGVLRMVRDVFTVSGFLELNTKNSIRRIVLSYVAAWARRCANSLRALLKQQQVSVILGEI